MFKRFNGYRPFMYNVTVDACRFLKNRKSSPVINFWLNVIENYTNFNHHCPFNVSIFPDNYVLNINILFLAWYIIRKASSRNCELSSHRCAALSRRRLSYRDQLDCLWYKKGWAQILRHYFLNWSVLFFFFIQLVRIWKDKYRFKFCYV